jgi:hypothetical protein
VYRAPMIAMSEELRYFLTALLLVVGGILPIVTATEIAPGSTVSGRVSG